MWWPHVVAQTVIMRMAKAEAKQPATRVPALSSDPLDLPLPSLPIAVDAPPEDELRSLLSPLLILCTLSKLLELEFKTISLWEPAPFSTLLLPVFMIFELPITSLKVPSEVPETLGVAVVFDVDPVDAGGSSALS